jgi:hypothetical protein
MAPMTERNEDLQLLAGPLQRGRKKVYLTEMRDLFSQLTIRYK